MINEISTADASSDRNLYQDKAIYHIQTLNWKVCYVLKRGNEKKLQVKDVNKNTFARSQGKYRTCLKQSFMNDKNEFSIF